jgi:hypothetical protein
MKTSWSETEAIEQQIHGFNDNGDALLFQAKLLLDNELAGKVQWQRKTYEVIQKYSRRQLKQEIETVHQKLFTQPAYQSFSQKIRRLFTTQ